MCANYCQSTDLYSYVSLNYNRKLRLFQLYFEKTTEINTKNDLPDKTTVHNLLPADATRDVLWSKTFS